jgi:hypothetical protein
MAVHGVLQSWKQIARYVGRTERTVQRWEQAFGLPVHRPSGKCRSSVMALTQEIEEWTRGKPSLVQLRKMLRVDRAALAVSDQLDTRLLIDRQRMLRKDLQTLLQEQRTLRQNLMQNLPKIG